MEASTILPLGTLYNNIDHGRLGTLDAAVCCMDKFDVHPTLYVAAHPIVGMFPLCHVADGYVFQCSLRLHAEYTLHRDKER